MPLENSFSIDKLDIFSSHYAVLASLRENERVSTWGGNVSKYLAPDSFLKEMKCPLLQVIHAVVTVVLKFFQEICRFVTRQSVQRNIYKIEELGNSLEELLKQKFPDSSEELFYENLIQLRRLQKEVKGTQETGLVFFEETCRNPFFQEKEALRDSQSKQISGIRESLGKSLSSFNSLLQKIEEEAYVKDLGKAKALLSQMQPKLDLAEKSEPYSHELAPPTPVRLFKLAAQEVLEKAYGKGAVARAFQYYHLDGKEVLSQDDFMALTVGIVANLTLQDLTGLDGESDSQEKESELLKKLNFLRAIDYTRISSEKRLPYHKQLAHDQTLLSTIEEVKEFDPEDPLGKNLRVSSVRKFCYAEYLARHLSYALFSSSKAPFTDGIVFPMYDKAGVLKLMQAHAIVSHEGLHGMVVKSAFSKEKFVPVQVVFRGTFCKYSLLRDFSPFETTYRAFFEGPGRSSFARKEEEIFKGIIQHTPEKKYPQIEFIGHSLGSCDAMRALESFIHRLQAQEEGPRFKEIALAVFNTPGVEPDIARRFIRSVQNFSKTHFQLRYFDVHHDAVQEFGAKRLGYCGYQIDKPENVQVTLVKFNRKLDERILMYAQNIFKRTVSFFEKALEAHCYHCIKLYDSGDKGVLNGTFIQDVFTNNPQDCGFVFGKESGCISEILLEKEKMDIHLITTTARIGRKMRGFFHEVIFTVTGGYCGLFEDTPTVEESRIKEEEKANFIEGLQTA